MDSCALPGISSGSIHIIMCLRTRRKNENEVEKAMLLFAAAAVAAGTVAGCSGSAKETTAASVAETNAEETKEETTAEETQKEKTAAEEEDEENYDTGDAALDNTRNQDEIGEKNF